MDFNTHSNKGLNQPHKINDRTERTVSYPRRLSQLASAFPPEEFAGTQAVGTTQNRRHRSSISTHIPLFSYSPTQPSRFGHDADGGAIHNVSGYLSPTKYGNGVQRRRSASFKTVYSTEDLTPRRSTQPLFRRANPEGGFISPLQAVTQHLAITYRICNPSFEYQTSNNPRRVLTKPSKPSHNDGFDNEDSDYILYVNDVLGEEEGHKYLILDVLGQGTFGQVVKCQNLKTQEVVAVKVIKNKPAYFNQSMTEVKILEVLNNKLDKYDEHHLLRLLDTFIHKSHLCLVFELLSVNLYELIKQNSFRGLSMNLVRVFASQLLDAMSVLSDAKIIHCDLKPENILLRSLDSPMLKVIDFGSACLERQTVYTYIQSRFYRSPEVLLGIPYTTAIDMWSLGCIVAELFLGLPLFPGSSEYNQICRITEMLGDPPHWMLEMGKQTSDFYDETINEVQQKQYTLKSIEKYSKEHNRNELPSKRYFQGTNLAQVVQLYPIHRIGSKPVDPEKGLFLLSFLIYWVLSFSYICKLLNVF